MTCIIPARGGSKRLPYKNVRQLFGHPVIGHVIMTCRAFRGFDRVVVSTEDEAIMEVADLYGAEVLPRPDYLADDDATETDVLKHAMARLEDDLYCRVYATAALLTADRLQKGALAFEMGLYHSVMEAQEYGHPIQRYIGSDGNYGVPGAIGISTALHDTTYHDAATFRFFRDVDTPLSEQRIAWLKIGEMDAQDVDTPEDWHALEAKFAWRYMRGCG